MPLNRLIPGALAGGLLAVVATIALAAAADDKAFIANVVGINMEEIQLGQLAQQKSTTASVKSYGQQLVSDHTMNNMQAMTIATKLGATVPKDLSADAKKTYDMLSAASGATFDKMFLDHMVMGHQMAIKLFTDQQASSNADVSGFAKMSLPVLQTHLMTAQMLQTAANKPG